jgi:hypothetical protein
LVVSMQMLTQCWINGHPDQVLQLHLGASFEDVGYVKLLLDKLG